MTDKTIKQRKQRMQALDKVRGIASVRVRVPNCRKDELKRLCAGWRKEEELRKEAQRV